MAGAGREPAAGETELRCRGFDQRHHLDWKRDWLEPCETACRDCDLLLCGQAIDKIGKSLLGLLQLADHGHIPRPAQPFQAILGQRVGDQDPRQGR